MRKIKVSHTLLKKALDKYEDEAIQLEEDVFDFLNTPHTSEDAKDQLAIVRTKGKKALAFHKLCRNYKSQCGEKYKRAATELCGQAKDLRKDIRSIETKVNSDYEQLWKEEEKKGNDRDMTPVYKVGFILAVPVGILTIYEYAPKIKESAKIIPVSLILGAAIAYNKNIRDMFSKAAKTANKNFTVYYLTQSAKEYKNKLLAPNRNGQTALSEKNKLKLG